MICPLCGTRNHAEYERCRICQHRLRPAEQSPATSRGSAPPYQHRLPLDSERPKVIPFESGRPAPRAARPPQPPAKPRPDVFQHKLELAAAAPRPAEKPQPAIYCDMPVAALRRRAFAAAIDGGLVLVGIGLFLAPLHVATGRVVLSLRVLPFYAVAAIALGLFYKLFWAIVGRDSPGARGARLRLLNFDGLPPTVRQRIIRLLAACFSVGGIGCGLLWALLDREKLTFHDHISKTFLTPTDFEPSSFQRKQVP